MTIKPMAATAQDCCPFDVTLVFMVCFWGGGLAAFNQVQVWGFGVESQGETPSPRVGA
jgi:hypothetical protein